jgi:hypothetical protein
MLSLIKKLSFVIFIPLLLIVYNISYAESSSPSFSCILTDTKPSDESPGSNIDKFTADTSKIYLSCYSDHVKTGQIIKTLWIADNTNNVAPPNYVIEKKEIEITSDIISANEGVTANFSLSKPNNGWPIGSYHVELYIDNKLDQSVKFTVK